MTARQGRHHPLRLAYAMVGAPTAWGIQFITIYALVDLGCGMNLSMALIKTLVLIVTGLALLAALVAGWLAVGLWRAEGNSGNGQTKLMAMVGAALSVIFALALVLSGIPVLLVSTCGEIAA